MSKISKKVDCSSCNGSGGVSRCCGEMAIEVNSTYKCSLCYRFCKMDYCGECENQDIKNSHEKVGQKFN